MTLIPLICIALVNILVDPFVILHDKNPRALGLRRVEFVFNQWMGKPYILEKRQPETIIFGSSRAGAALRCLPLLKSKESCYNFALPGSNSRSLRLAVEHALVTTPIRRAILTVDFFGFNVEQSENTAREIELFAERTRGLNDSFWNLRRWNRMLNDGYSYLLSWPVVLASVRTLVLQDDIESGKRNVQELVDDGGWDYYRGRFWLVEEDFLLPVRNYARERWFPAPERTFTLSNARRSPMTDFQKVVSTLHKRGIETYIVILPVHSYLLEGIYRAHLWPTFEKWKRELVQINETENTFGGENFPLWDFATFSALTEQTPLQGEIAENSWFVDAAHASERTGELVLKQILYSENSSPKSYAARLDGHNIESWLSAGRTSHEIWQISHKFEADRIGYIVDEALRLH